MLAASFPILFMTHSTPCLFVDYAIVGAGPAGLMAAQHLSAAGQAVQLFDAMPTPARKFLIAGRGGLNLSHSEDFEPFVQRYAESAEWQRPMLQAFDNQAMRDWAEDLGIGTFVGTSGRIFPLEMKAAPLLRAWQQRLRHPPAGGQPVTWHMRWRWLGWTTDGRLRFATPEGERQVQAAVTLLALGGASWPHLGSDAAWVPVLRQAGVTVLDLAPSNCGFVAAGRSGSGWSPYVQALAGQALKTLDLHWLDADGQRQQRRGECVVSHYGLEGSVIYAASAAIRQSIARHGQATVWLNLLPDYQAAALQQLLAQRPKSASLSSYLKKRCKLDTIKLALLHELAAMADLHEPQRLACVLQALPVVLTAARPIAEAISAAGGIDLAALDPDLMLHTRPGVFCAGEMLNWEAPTGGYLLTACMAQGLQAAKGMMRYFHQPPPHGSLSAQSQL